MDEQSRNLLLTRLEDLAARAGKTGCAASKFLTPAEAAEAARAFGKRRDIRFFLDGGFRGAERQCAVFTEPDWGVYDRDSLLCAIAFHHRKQDSVRHQDVLGAVLALGLSREVLGDISAGEERAVLVCLSPMADYITDRVDKLGRVGVKAERIPLEQLPDLSVGLRQQQVTVASLRLDAVIAAAFHLSRAEASSLIESGLVKLDHAECLSPSKAPAEGSVLSVQGKGRIKLSAVLQETKKGRLRLSIGYY